MTKDTVLRPLGCARRGEDEGTSDDSVSAFVQTGSGRGYNPADIE